MVKETITTPTDPLEAALRKLVKSLMKQSGKPRAIIAKRMTAPAGRSVSKRMIDDWVSPKMRARFPAALVEAFCEAIDDDTLQRHVIGARLRKLIEVGERVSGMGKTVQEIHDRIVDLTGQEGPTTSKR